jgi:hypothetical protein
MGSPPVYGGSQRGCRWIDFDLLAPGASPDATFDLSAPLLRKRIFRLAVLDGFIPIELILERLPETQTTIPRNARARRRARERWIRATILR